ncbi:MAG: ATP-binding cassette domain-containing protein [Rickettsiales bacterium]|jgi:ATPase subunit of ABC transporter with duplicated ATPase domains|nr:ATP-binding cassette domain-containing protein [Rickettsiales bacterium]
MAIISAENIRYENARGVLFKDVSLYVNKDDKIGVVGNNGSGKTTLIKCLVGKLELNGGNINMKKGTKIGYVEQGIPKELESETFYDVLRLSMLEEERDCSTYRVDMALEALGAPKSIWQLELGKLSGGWKKLALVSKTYLKNPDILILDEPTNHLDLSKAMHLERWLREIVYDIPYIIISHDREFLDNCTNKTIVLRNGIVCSFKHSYTDSMKLLAEQDRSDEKKRKIQEKEVDRLSKTAKDFKQKGQAHGSERLARVAKTIESRIDRIENELVDIYKEDERSIGLGENEVDYNRPILKISNLDVKTPDDRFLFNVDSLEISKGERIVILGLNGTGKSLLVKQLMETYRNLKAGLQTSKKHEIIFNPRVEIGYIDQNLSLLPDEKSLRSFMQEEFSLDVTSTISSLVNIGFRFERQDTPVKDLSFGEKVRLTFLKLRHQKPNMYLMDEPTSHLDIDGQLKLKEAILSNDNPCIFVSHDRRFLREIANRYYMIDEIRKKLKLIDSPDIFFEKLLGNVE